MVSNLRKEKDHQEEVKEDRDVCKTEYTTYDEKQMTESVLQATSDGKERCG